MDDIRERILQEAEDALTQYESASISLAEYTRSMEQPINDAMARGEEHDGLVSLWMEIEIINAITLDVGRMPDEAERAAALAAGRRLLGMARRRLA